MKLVELLARELREWPECKTITQDYDGDTGLYRIDTPELCNGDPNDAVWTAIGHMKNIKQLSELATDHASAIVTREMWQAEKDRIAAPKQTKDGWIRHHGGKCPVSDGGLKIEVRLRDGTCGIEKASFYSWSHDCGLGDIMAYRVCEPVVEPVQIVEHEPACEIYNAQAIEHGPLQWRDRITQIDADIKFEQERHISNMACMDQERADLVANLAAEGFALIAPVVEPAEDMSDWRNWKAGDLLERISDAHPNVYTPGNIYAILHFDDRLPCVNDNYGPASYCQIMLHELEMFKFHSRPTN